MAEKSKFLEIMREKLQERFNVLLNGGNPREAFETLSQRMLWYMCVDEYRSRYDDDEKTDLVGSEERQYRSYLGAIRNFCNKLMKEHAGEVNAIDDKLTVYWGLLRKALGIDADERAIGHGFSGENILIVPENSEKYRTEASMMVICEKSKFAEKWLGEMRERGWGSINLVVTKGFSVAELVEVIQDIRKDVENGETHFYIGILHDLDVSGECIKIDLEKWYDILDFGVNFEMLDNDDPENWDNFKERSKHNPKQLTQLTDLGETKFLERVGNSRLELDNLYTKKGIQIFADYAEKVISENCKIWDLNRLGEPVALDPEEYTDCKEKIEQLWAKIVLKVTGKDEYDLFLTECSWGRKDEIKNDNKDFEGSVDDIKNYRETFDEQNEELQKLVDEDPENQKIVEGLGKLMDEIKIDEIIRKIEVNANT